MDFIVPSATWAFVALMYVLLNGFRRYKEAEYLHAETMHEHGYQEELLILDGTNQGRCWRQQPVEHNTPVQISGGDLSNLFTTSAREKALAKRLADIHDIAKQSPWTQPGAGKSSEMVEILFLSAPGYMEGETPVQTAGAFPGDDGEPIKR